MVGLPGGDVNCRAFEVRDGRCRPCRRGGYGLPGRARRGPFADIVEFLPDRPQQLVAVERFAQDPPQRFVFRAGNVVGGKVDDTEAGAAHACHAGQGEPVDPIGHDDVGQQNVDPLAAVEMLQCRDVIGDRDHVEPGVFQHEFEGAKKNPVVLDQQNARGRSLAYIEAAVIRSAPKRRWLLLANGTVKLSSNGRGCKGEQDGRDNPLRGRGGTGRRNGAKMDNTAKDLISGLIERRGDRLLDEWLGQQRSVPGLRGGPISESELGEQSRRFLAAFRHGIEDGDLDDISGPGWTDARSQLEELSASRASLGFTPSETAMFVFSLKEPLFALIATRAGRERRRSPARSGPPRPCSTGSASIRPSCTSAAARRSSHASRRSCSNSRPRWSSSGRAFWRCR